DIPAREMPAVELADVVERDGAQAADRALRRMRVARAAEDERVEGGLRELLVRRVAERVLDVGDGVALEALEVASIERGPQMRVGEERHVAVEGVAMRAAGERRPLLVDAHGVGGRERVERGEDLVVRVP